MQLYNIIDWCHQWWWFGNWGHHRVGHDHLHNAVKHSEHSVHNCSLLIPLHFLMWHLKIDISDANYYNFLGGISHQIVAHRLAGEWWEARTLILPQYRALPHSVKLLPPSRYSFTQCYRNIADVLSIWVFSVDYLVVRKSTLQKSHYSLILGAWGWPSRDPIFPLPTESILLRWSIQHQKKS